ncbi:MAG TPA: TolC family protein [Casimicrobium sp.]|nr:TolC family protein [Casimicrobium sp.]HPV22841.1 TolC family protein [Casimicrobium sp.]
MSFFNRAPLCARSILFLAIFTSLTVLPAGAQINTTSRSAVTATSALLTLAESFQLALAQQPWTLAASERQREQQSREALADSWLADSPTIASGLKTGNRDGLREFEVEISAPIATASRRALQVASVRGESAAYTANLAQLALKLAGEVRDAYWAVQLAAGELTLAEDEVKRAEQVATDSARRTAAGDSARVDTLQAELTVQTLRSTRVEAEQRLNAARQVLRGLIGEAANRGLADTVEPRGNVAPRALNDHPSLRLAGQTEQLARARLNDASALTNSAPTVSFALTNERSNGSANASTARIGISFPFGGTQRAAPRIAQAGAELAEAQASVPLLRRQLEADAMSAQAAMVSAERRIEVLTERGRLANEVATLYAKAYRLGELDLPTRLRAEGERANASLALSRARIELMHAISRVNQSLGLLP